MFVTNKNVNCNIRCINFLCHHCIGTEELKLMQQQTYQMIIVIKLMICHKLLHKALLLAIIEGNSSK